MVRDHHDIFTIFRFFGADSLKEHLAAQLQNQGGAADQFKSAFIKTHNSLAPNPRSAESLSKQNAGFRIANILKPKYACLTCSESFLNSGRKAHTEKSGHQFCKFVSFMAGRPRSNFPVMESRSRTLFCQGCGDFVYDHGLERLRSSTSESALKRLIPPHLLQKNKQADLYSCQKTSIQRKLARRRVHSEQCQQTSVCKARRSWIV